MAVGPPEQVSTSSEAEIDSVLDAFGRDPSYVIPALQAVQRELGYLPPATFRSASRHFRISAAQIHGIATFYAQFYLQPQGRHTIKVCRGTACHVRGSSEILAELERTFGIKTGQTTPDMKFTLERVACFGSCALAPVVVVNDEVHGRMTAEKTLKLIEGLE